MQLSAIYETEPVGCEPGAAKFLNAAVEFGYEGQPGELLHALGTIEKTLGRPANHGRNVSRKIDLDLLYFGEAVTTTTELALPHPRIFGREFVLRPLADIRPDLILPGQPKSVAQLLAAFPVSRGVVRLDLEW